MRLCQPGRRASTDWKGVTFGQAPQNSRGPDVARSAPVLPCLEREIIKRAEVAHLKTLLLRGFLQA
jgi:hypothetical protein